MRTILFICTGNTCRSPMAEAIARHALDHDPALAPVRGEVFIASAGMSALDGLATSAETIEALNAMGIQHEGRAKRLNEQMIRKADHILCMTAAQRDAALRLVESPDEQSKIVLVDPARDIDDPIGHGRGAYDALARDLAAAIPARLRELLRPATVEGG